MIHNKRLTAGDHITPVENEVTSTAGQSVTLNCTYDTSSNSPLLYWYRHHPNQAPQFILYKGAKSYSDLEEIPDDRYQSTTSVTSTKLVIQQLTLSDTALYYCALRDHSDTKSIRGCTKTYRPKCFVVVWIKIKHQTTILCHISEV
uniref:T-cell receptor alpha/delta variable 22.0 n=1 Tax=Esox lucius TaxID=8010 RepID=A0A3P8Y438_ESOLU